VSQTVIGKGNGLDILVTNEETYGYVLEYGKRIQSYKLKVSK
jgi:hypothetical protein